MTLREEILKNSGILNETILLTKPGELYVKFWNYVFLVRNTGKVYTSSAKSDNKELYDYIMSATTISVYNWKNIHNTFGENKVVATITPKNSLAKQEETIFTEGQAKSIIEHIISAKRDDLIKFINNNVDKFTPEEKEYLDKVKKYLEK